jgi:predicted enzyme related to lactoylglutathione lyase
MEIKFVHTNIIAKDWRKLSRFYQQVFGLRPVPPPRDLSGAWVEELTGIPGVHIIGEHLSLPGYEGTLPTLEIFSYNISGEEAPKILNRPGFAHIAFHVENVPAMLQKVLDAGGAQVGRLVKTQVNGRVALFVYAADIEGNIIELQHWG